MRDHKKFIVSHAPFWHNGNNRRTRNYTTMLAALPAIIFGLFRYGAPALGVIGLCVSSAMIWEYLINRISKQNISIGDGDSALIGLIFAMLLPAVSPWWLVITGTFVAVVIGKQIFGGIGGNPFHPVAVSFAFLMLSWQGPLDFDQAYVNYDFGPVSVYPLTALKYFGVSAIETISNGSLLMGRQIGGIGSTFGLGLIIGGIFLIFRGIIRWEVSVSFLGGIFVTAAIFNLSDPTQYAGPLFHLLAGYTLMGAIFLATEDSSSPVNFIPMLIYGATGGILTVLIRNIGAFVDGVIFAILIINLINPLLDKIKPKALGKVM